MGDETNRLAEDAALDDIVKAAEGACSPSMPHVFAFAVRTPKGWLTYTTATVPRAHANAILEQLVAELRARAQ